MRARFSRQNIFALFVACAFPVHIWAIVGLLNRVPAWILRVNLWELAGMVGLTLVLTFLETVLVTAGIAALAALVPGQWFTDRMVPLSALFIWLTSILSVITHFQEPLMRSFWGLAILLVYLGSLAGSAWLLSKSEKFSSGLDALIERLAVLTGLYIVFDAAGLIIVIIRNV